MVIGHFCKLLGGTAGETATKVLGKASEVQVACSKTEVESTTRETEGFKTYIAGLKDISLSFKHVYDPEDEGYQLLHNAFYNDTPLSLRPADNDGNGLEADWEIFTFDESQDDDDIVRVSVTAKPTRIAGEKARNPKWEKGTEATGTEATGTEATE